MSIEPKGKADKKCIRDATSQPVMIPWNRLKFKWNLSYWFTQILRLCIDEFVNEDKNKNVNDNYRFSFSKNENKKDYYLRSENRIKTTKQASQTRMKTKTNYFRTCQRQLKHILPLFQS
jgi:hypothetical protein